MIKRKQIGQAIAALVLLCALMLPTATQFSHIFEGHEQVDCKEQNTHYHEYVPDCHICHFHLASYSYDIPVYPDFLGPSIAVGIKNQFSSPLFHSFKATNTQLRAPPSFS